MSRELWILGTEQSENLENYLEDKRYKVSKKKYSRALSREEYIEETGRKP